MRQRGFTAIELLITLFIAAAFLMSGYQLYGLIIKDSGEAKAQAVANNVVYDYLQKYQDDANDPCTAQTPLTNQPITETGISNATVTVAIECPYGTSFSLSKVKVSVKYDIKYTGAEKTVSNSAFVKGPCPAGFIPVPGSDTYGTDDFCVMKYEAKNVGGVATSQAALAPWVSITQTTAITTAAAACTGCHLITEAEWLTIAQNVLSVDSNWDNGAGVHTMGTGYIYSGHNDNAPIAGLPLTDASVDDNAGYYLTGNVAPSNQRRTLTLTNDEVIWDLAGNVHEWTQGTIPGGAQPGLSGESAYAWKEWTDALFLQNGLFPSAMLGYTGLTGASGWNSDKGVGGLRSNYAETAVGYFRRGGQFSFGPWSGIFTLYIQNSDGSATDTGFRVAR
jgi:prepilin-type N-terminal cleavage/methylation domain-containing protein